MRFRCYPRSASATFVLYCGLPEWEDMNFLRDYLRSGDGFVDVGANVGVYSLLAADMAGVEVWAFEPSSDSLSRLRENVTLNRLGDRVHILAAAAGARPGTAVLSSGLDTTNRVVEHDRWDGGRETIAVVTLDAAVPAVDRRRVTLVKIDVEGAERSVLEGARELLGAARPVVIVEANDPAGLHDLLAPIGYRPYAYDPDGRTLTSRSWEKGAGNNLILVADLGAARARLDASREVSDPPSPTRTSASGQ
jgi:FkbM family methyltransferase